MVEKGTRGEPDDTEKILGSLQRTLNEFLSPNNFAVFVFDKDDIEHGVAWTSNVDPDVLLKMFKWCEPRVKDKIEKKRIHDMMAKLLVKVAHELPSIGNCHNCGNEMKGYYSPFGGGESKPEAGQFGMCGRCGCISVFTEDGGLREPTTEEVLQSTRMPELQAARKVVDMTSSWKPDEKKEEDE